MVKGQYSDSLTEKFEQEIMDYKIKSITNEEINKRLGKKIENQSLMLQNREESISILQQQIKEKEKKLKRAKWHKIILGVASAASSAAIILK